MAAVALAYGAAVRSSSSASLDLSVELENAGGSSIPAGAEPQRMLAEVATPPVSKPALAASTRASEVLVGPSVAAFLQWYEIGRLHAVSATVRNFAEDRAVAPGLWMAACVSLGTEEAL